MKSFKGLIDAINAYLHREGLAVAGDSPIGIDFVHKKSLQEFCRGDVDPYAGQTAVKLEILARFRPGEVESCLEAPIIAIADSMDSALQASSVRWINHLEETVEISLVVRGDEDHPALKEAMAIVAAKKEAADVAGEIIAQHLMNLREKKRLKVLKEHHDTDMFKHRALALSNARYLDMAQIARTWESDVIKRRNPDAHDRELLEGDECDWLHGMEEELDREGDMLRMEAESIGNWEKLLDEATYMAKHRCRAKVRNRHEEEAGAIMERMNNA